MPHIGDGDKKEWLGYIRFKGGSDGKGSIDITNRSATLQPWHLDLGGTSKAGDAHQAGAHGEGLKISLLVLMRGRQNHSVRCRSGGFNWKFNFTTRGRLVARLRRMKPEAIHKAQDQARRLSERTLLPFAANPNLDVQFVIGEAQAGRDEWGSQVTRSQVQREDFDAWTKAALFLQDDRDGAIISTENGDLLTAPQLCGHLYLKGLLLCASTPTRSASITDGPLKFGYNFASGSTNRERQSVSGADEEATAILAIWSSALDAKPEMVAELSAMLNTTEPRYADVSGAKMHMDFATACRLKEYLFGSQFAGKWYYCSEDKNQVPYPLAEARPAASFADFLFQKNPRLDHIIQGLGCEGTELTNAYWAILRRHDLIHTAEEEEYRRFTAAPPVTAAALESAFATSVQRLLCACVRACPKTNGIAINFVQAGQLHLQLFYSEEERLFRAHERWLSVRGAIDELGLPDDLMELDVVFHTVKRLFAEALEQMPREVFVEEDDVRTGEWRRKLEVSRAEQRLLNYLRMGNLRVDTVPKRHGLHLRWDFDSRQSFDTGIEVQCHRASRCSHLRGSLLTAEDGEFL